MSWQVNDFLTALTLSLPSDTSANLLAKLQSMAPEKTQDVIAELADSADAFYN